MLCFYKTIDNVIKRIDTFSEGCWINVVSPTPEEIAYLTEELSLDRSFVSAALDEEESSRVEVEDDQTLIIIAGSTGLCPLTGITLPFISSGGSSLVVTFMIVGIMIAVSSNVKWKGLTDNEEEFFKENAVFTKCHAYLRHLNDHIPHPDVRAAAGRLRGGRQTEAGGKGKHVSKGIRPGQNFGSRGKHSRVVRKAGKQKNVQ